MLQPSEIFEIRWNRAFYNILLSISIKSKSDTIWVKCIVTINFHPIWFCGCRVGFFGHKHTKGATRWNFEWLYFKLIFFLLTDTNLKWVLTLLRKIVATLFYYQNHLSFITSWSLNSQICIKSWKNVIKWMILVIQKVTQNCFNFISKCFLGSSIYNLT